VVASSPECLAAALSVARASLTCRVIGLMHAWHGIRGVTLDYDLQLAAFGSRECDAYPELLRDAWVLHGGVEDAVLCGLDPSHGMLAELGLDAALCISGLCTQGALGADSDANPAIAGARRCSIVGVPALAVCSPSTSPAALPQLVAALARILPPVVRVLSDTYDSKCLSSAVNCPRAHFPFPTEGRWAALGSTQLPIDPELQAILWESHSEYAARDCWSLGDPIAPSTATTASGTDESPAGRRATLRRAFRDGDVFLCAHVSPNWDTTASKPFSSTRPGVLWHQDQVTHPSAPSASPSDLWGRSLPVQALQDVQPRSEGAVFVSQRNTEKVIANTRGGVYSSESRPDTPPLSFRIGKGTVLMDASPRGDVDAVMARKACVTVMQTWPPAHPFSLLDQVIVEALREGREGLPLWLTEEDDDNGRR